MTTIGSPTRSPDALDQPIARGDAGAEPDGCCIACHHPHDSHDAIASRYCQATVAQALTRGCICRAS
jgi:hypothetical protein